MSKADYSIATEEEREQVVQILERNLHEMAQGLSQVKARQLRQLVEQYCERVRQGAVITGSEFETLVKLFRKEPPV